MLLHRNNTMQVLSTMHIHNAAVNYLCHSFTMSNSSYFHLHNLLLQIINNYQLYDTDYYLLVPVTSNHPRERELVLSGHRYFMSVLATAVVIVELSLTVMITAISPSEIIFFFFGATGGWSMRPSCATTKVEKCF